MTSIAYQSASLVSRAETITSGLDDTHRAVEPGPGLKTAGWLVGHLAVSGDVARRWLGREPSCPREWYDAFLPGSQPSQDPDDYPAMESLIASVRFVYPDLAEALASATPNVLARENPYEPAREGFPTLGDFASYLLTGHLAYHLGQLFAWRAAAGVGP